MAILVNDYDTVFLHNPKCAGMSVTKWLKDNFKTTTLERLHCKIDKIKIPYKIHFIVTRNPFERLVSWYYFNVQLNKYKPYYSEWKHADTIGFNKWIEICNKTGDDYTNPIWYTQKSYINISKEHVVCRLENINRDFIKIQDLLNCYKPLNYINKSKHNSYQQEYSNDAKNIVETYFKEDLEYFNYEF